MIGMLETIIIYIVLGLVFNAYDDVTGETWKILRGLIYKALWWPKTLYTNYIKIEEGK